MTEPNFTTTKSDRDKLKEVDRRLCHLLHFIRGMDAGTRGPNPLLDEMPEVMETNDGQ